MCTKYLLSLDFVTAEMEPFSKLPFNYQNKLNIGKYKIKIKMGVYTNGNDIWECHRLINQERGEEGIYWNLKAYMYHPDMREDYMKCKGINAYKELYTVLDTDMKVYSNVFLLDYIYWLLNHHVNCTIFQSKLLNYALSEIQLTEIDSQYIRRLNLYIGVPDGYVGRIGHLFGLLRDPHKPYIDIKSKREYRVTDLRDQIIKMLQ